MDDFVTLIQLDVLDLVELEWLLTNKYVTLSNDDLQELVNESIISEGEAIKYLAFLND